MQQFPLNKTTSIDGQIYQDILDTIKAILKRHFDKATPMYAALSKKQELFGWHLLLSKDEENADYFVLYETTLFNSVAQVRFLRGPYQLQYILEPGNIIVLSQFRLSDIGDDYSEWDYAHSQEVITINQLISNAEASGLLLQLKNLEPK